MKTPDQSIYDHVTRIAMDKGYTVYPFNPDPGTKYPYVKMGGAQLIPRATKSYMIGEVELALDVWGDKYSRKNVADIATDILVSVGGSTKTADGYQIMLNQNRSSIEVMTDNSTSDDLWRARVTLSIKFF